MKILTDKVYYNGKEFIVNNWPVIRDADTYDSLLSRAIEEGYVVRCGDMGEIFRVDSLAYKSIGFHTLPEPREFECTEEPNYKSSSKEYFNRIAILLPKQPVTSPEPSEEINIDWIIGIESEAKEALDELPVALCADDNEENIFFQGYYAAASRYKKGNPDKEQEELWKQIFHQVGSRMDFMKWLQENFVVTRKQKKG